MRRGPVGWLLLSACLLLVACTPSRGWTPGPIIVESPTPTVTTPRTPASPSPTATPPPTVPDAGGAINADAFEHASFVSPSGRIWCALHDGWALCHFPRGMDPSGVPGTEEVCPELGLDVTGVSVVEKADYFCSGDSGSMPQTNGSSVGWWKGSGLPSVTYEGQKLAVLPYGKKLARKGYVCLSERAGVTCGNTATGAGFRVALAGVTFVS